MDNDFRTWFEDIPIDTGVVCDFKTINRYMNDAEILAEFKPESVSLGDFVETLQNGRMLKDDYTKIFYIKDKNGVLRTVYVDWNDDCWLVGASSVEDPRRWYSGNLVFSRVFNAQNPNPMERLEARVERLERLFSTEALK